MQKRYLPVTVLAVILAAAGIGGYLAPIMAEPDAKASPQRVLMPNTGGTVVFEHNRHAALPDMTCQTCHHDSRTASPAPADVRACAQCHGQTFDDAFRAQHRTTFDAASCATCHHYELARKDWGHDRHAQELGLDCRDCHHKNEEIEPEPTDCASCHESGKAPTRQKAQAGTPPNLADAVHARCITCHEDMFASKANGCASCHELKSMRTAPADGKVSSLYADCATCHETGAQKLIPGRMDAFHGQCMGCHQKLGKGPFEKSQCAQCHTK